MYTRVSYYRSWLEETMMQHAPPVFCSAGPSAAAAVTQTSQNTACSKCGDGGSEAEVCKRLPIAVKTFNILRSLHPSQELRSPWLVGLHDMTTGALFCGGTLVASRYVVTAASCVQARTPWDLYAVLGHGHRGLETQRGITRVHVHEGYSPEQPTLSNAALLELDREVELATHTPACVDTNPGPDLELRGAVYQK